MRNFERAVIAALVIIFGVSMLIVRRSDQRIAALDAENDRLIASIRDTLNNLETCGPWQRYCHAIEVDGGDHIHLCFTARGDVRAVSVDGDGYDEIVHWYGPDEGDPN